MTADLVLRRATLEDEKEVLRAHRDTSPETPSFLHSYKEGIPFGHWLEVLAERERGVNPPSPRHVPETLLLALVGSRVVGRAAIRHALNESLSREGGHIGYVVVPECRRRGYATAILRLAVAFAREQLRLERLLVTCDDDNVGSIKTIERNGGVLHDVIPGPDPARSIRRYWIAPPAGDECAVPG